MNAGALAAALALLAAVPPAHSQTGRMAPSAAPLPSPLEVIRRTFTHGDYLAPYLALQRSEAEYLASEPWSGLFLDFAALHASFVGDHATALRYASLRDEAAEPDSAADHEAAAALAGAAAEDAVAAVVAAAGGRRAVFVNEAHHVAGHRALTARLLAPLYEQGFRYLALEAAEEDDAALRARGYPAVRRTGLYTSEPVFGEVVREALRLGYTIIPFDVTEPVAPRADDPYFAANERERIQARNLVDRVFARDPGARVLVQAGYGHILEEPLGEWRPMAVWFREISGIDPLSVDQTVMMEHATPASEHPVYRAAVRGGLVADGPVVLRAPGGEPLVRGFAVDLQVFQPRSPRGGRPAWLRLGGARDAYPVDVDGVCGRAPCLVQAYAAGEGPDAVPADQALVERPDGHVELFLRPGAYRIRVIDASGRVTAEYRATAGAGAMRRDP